MSVRIARLLVSAAVATALLSCAGRPPRSVSAPPVGADDATLGAGDVFDVRVFGEEDLTGTYRVAPDGTIDYPFLGRVEVAGLEPTAIADLVASRLQAGGFLRGPQVSIFVREYNSKRVSVLGAVARPGTFPMTSGLTVVQAVSLAGGFTSIASRNGTVVSRRIDGQLRRFRVPVESVAEGTSEDFPLQAGDIVYVPERFF